MKVVFLQGAEDDLKELRRYVVSRFGRAAWNDTSAQTRSAVHAIGKFPLQGRVPDELVELDLDQYRQVITGLNRLIYEIVDGTVVIHVVCDTRRELRTLLMRRLMRARH